MRDPIPKSNRNTQFAHYSNGQTGKSSSANQGQKRNKSDYCWNFNKGVPCKFSNKCKFVEKCKYCDSSAHGVHACPKLQKRTGTGAGDVKSDQDTSK